jgi:hypothetical protein
MVDIAGREAGYRPVYPLFQRALGAAAVIQLQQITTAVLDAHVVYEGKLPPPPALRFVLKLIIYYGYEFLFI